MDAVVNLNRIWTGTLAVDKTSETEIYRTHASFPDVRLASAIQNAARRPRFSCNPLASIVTACAAKALRMNPHPADDFLAQLTVPSEAATKPVEELGVRRVITRNAVVLAGEAACFRSWLFPRAFSLAEDLGRQTSHAMDPSRRSYECHAISAGKRKCVVGLTILISPAPTSNAEFMRAVANALHRPYWFHVPKFLLTIGSGRNECSLN